MKTTQAQIKLKPTPEMLKNVNDLFSFRAK